MTSNTNNIVPVASIDGASGSTAGMSTTASFIITPFLTVVSDSLATLFSQLNVHGNNAVTLSSALHRVVQNAVVAALQEVAIAAGAPAIPASAPPVTTAPPVITADPPAVTSATPANIVAIATIRDTRTHHGVTYDVPHPNASGPFYWVNRGRRIGVFATW